MNIPTEITKHIEEQAEVKAKKRALEATKILAEEVTARGDLNVPAPNGGVITINGVWLEQLQASIINSSRDHFQKIELDAFLEQADAALAGLKPKK
jgi:hypothetical protein